MCEFVSWVERRSKNYFLTDKQLATKRGQELIKTISLDDLCGHGTIRAYYRIDSGDGIDKECTNFSSPANFPDVISQAIKNGEITRFGIAGRLLTQQAWAEYKKIKQPAFWKIFKQEKYRNPKWR